FMAPQEEPVYTPPPLPTERVEPEPAAQPGPDQPAQTPSSDPRLRKLVEVARLQQVDLQIRDVQGSRVTVDVSWMGVHGAKGGEYIDALLRQGTIRDFNQVGESRIWYDRDTRRHYGQSFELYLK
ncbi:hypothetical protein HQ520_14515, partial [bacterium]|nr:hypothetical protein [bacterium]